MNIRVLLAGLLLAFSSLTIANDPLVSNETFTSCIFTEHPRYKDHDLEELENAEAVCRAFSEIEDRLALRLFTDPRVIEALANALTSL